MAGAPILMSLGDWLFIDAVMDNAAQSAVAAYDDVLAARARSIRHLGWDATGHITRPLSEQGLWPPGDDVLGRLVSIPLGEGDSKFVAGQLVAASEVSDILGQDESAARGRVLANRITEHLTEGTV
jgi:hypothetical protein